MIKVLVIDDNADIRTTIKHMLGPLEASIAEAEDGVRGVASYRANPADVVILDIFMPEKDGIETLADLRRLTPGVPVIAISGGGSHGFTGVLKTASLMGAVCTLDKPFSQAQLLAAVESVLPKQA
jgi:CheY-like chemotaxis protein